MTLSDMVKAMAAAGCTSDQIALAISALDEARRERARAGNRERKAIQRARHASHAVTSRDDDHHGDECHAFHSVTSRDKRDGEPVCHASHGVTCVTDTTPAFSPFPPQEIYNQPPLTPTSTPPAIRARASRLPDGWTPSDAGQAFAAQRIGGQAEDELERFRDYWRAKSGRDATKIDWDATWRNWVRTAAQRQPMARAGPSHGFSGRDGGDRAAQLLRAFEASNDEHPDNHRQAPRTAIAADEGHVGTVGASPQRDGAPRLALRDFVTVGGDSWRA